MISLRKCSKIGFSGLPVKHWHVSEEEPADSVLWWNSQWTAGNGWTPQGGHVRAWDSQKQKTPRTCVLTAPGRSSREPWEPHLTLQGLLSCFTLEIWMVPTTGVPVLCWSRNLKHTWMKYFSDLQPLAFHTHILETSNSQMLSSPRNRILQSGAAAGAWSAGTTGLCP